MPTKIAASFSLTITLILFWMRDNQIFRKNYGMERRFSYSSFIFFSLFVSVLSCFSSVVITAWGWNRQRLQLWLLGAGKPGRWRFSIKNQKYDWPAGLMELIKFRWRTCGQYVKSKLPQLNHVSLVNLTSILFNPIGLNQNVDQLFLLFLKTTWLVEKDSFHWMP